jgi:small conductance mechanosensitive channel
MEMNFQKALDTVTNKVSGWLEYTITMLPNFALALLILLAFVFVGWLTRKAVLKIDSRFESNDAIVRLIANFVYAGIIITGLFAALSILKLDKTVTSLLAGAGIIGLALGFAFQETAANFLSGVLMAIRKPFKVGDLIETNSFMGYVRELNLRATIMRNFQGQELIIPNKTVFYHPIVNYTKSGMRRVDLEVGISYGDSLPKVKQVTLDAIESIEGLHPNMQTKLWFTGFGNSSINFIVAFWLSSTEHASFLEARSQAVMAIHKAYAENEITIPFPIRTLDFGIKGGKKLEDIKIQLEKLNRE